MDVNIFSAAVTLCLHYLLQERKKKVEAKKKKAVYCLI